MWFYLSISVIIIYMHNLERTMFEMNLAIKTLKIEKSKKSEVDQKYFHNLLSFLENNG